MAKYILPEGIVEANNLKEAKAKVAEKPKKVTTKKEEKE